VPQSIPAAFLLNDAQGINRHSQNGRSTISLRHAKEAFRDAQRKLDPNRTPELYDFALGMRLLVEGLEEELTAIKRRIAELENHCP